LNHVNSYDCIANVGLISGSPIKIVALCNLETMVCNRLFKIKPSRMKIDDLNPEILERAANMLKALAHPMRVAILAQLEDGKKLSVTELHTNLGIEQSTASHHLGILKDKGVLASSREGKNTFYYLKHEGLRDIIACLCKCAGSKDKLDW